MKTPETEGGPETEVDGGAGMGLAAGDAVPRRAVRVPEAHHPPTDCSERQSHAGQKLQVPKHP